MGYGKWTETGTTYNLGQFPAGTELIFYIVHGDSGNRWFSGPESRNSDGVVHAAVVDGVGSQTWIVQFEDVPTGGDRDYNDVRLYVKGNLYITTEFNSPPVWTTPIGNKTISENQLLSFPISASDPDGNNLTYSYSNLPPGASFDATSHTFSWTPNYDQAGSYNVTFTVADDGSPPMSISETITIAVGNANRPPKLTPILDRSAKEDTPLMFMISASDPDGDSLSYSAGNLPPGAIFDKDTQTFSWTPDYTQNGDYKVTFTVTDNGSPPMSISEEITVKVGNVNAPPKFNPIGNKDVKEAEALTFKVTATDVDTNDTLSYSASTLPAGATFTEQTFSWTPDYAEAGQYQVTFRVDDNGNPAKFAEEKIWIYVGNVNRHPVLAPIGSKSAYTGEPLEFVITAKDPDGDPLIYSASNLPAGANFNASTQKFSWTPTQDQAGVYNNILFKVTDTAPDGSLEASETIAITVNLLIPVTIDIKPGDYPNSINLGSGGVTPVAILSAPGFDATQIDPLTVTLANAQVRLRGKGTPMASKTDVNGDGLMDLVVHVDTSTMSMADLQDQQATLWGRTYDGAYIKGYDSVRIVP